MPNPWDNDPIVRKAGGGGNPWDNDPIVKPAGAVGASDDAPGMLSSLAASLGKGVGSVALGAQKLVGKGIQSVGETVTPDKQTLAGLVSGKKDRGLIQSAGDWLVSDADKGKAKLEAELAPYKAANPFTTTVGELGGNVLATLPVGGFLGKGVQAAAPALTRIGVSAPTIQSLANSVASGGFRTGAQAATTAGGRIADLAMRGAGGAVTGGASSALIDPSSAGTGALVGAALPGVVRASGAAGSKIRELAESGAESLMQSAIKPTIKQLANGEAATAVRTLLDYGISPTRAGVSKIRDLVDGLNTQIADKIANSTATIPKSNVLRRLSDVESTFGNQVSPTADLASIQRVADDFAAHPLYPGADIPVQAAQTLKQGTYKTLSKKYGQMGGAETEAQKGLARGLKEEIANAVPEVAGLNAEEAKLITTLKVSERRALMEMNKNPMGLAALAGDPKSWAMFMADRSSAFKALAARMVDSSAKVASKAAPALEAAMANPLLRNATTTSVASSRRE